MTPPNKTRIVKTIKNFLQELPLKNEAFRNGEIEIVSEYQSDLEPVEVKDKYGITLISPMSLLKGAKPRLLAAKDKNTYFKEMLREVWGDGNFPNLLTDYVDSETKFRVEKDGFVFLVRPSSLLIGNKYDIIENAEDQTALAISKLVAVHGDRYDYSKVKYNKSNGKITVICKEHGEFEQTFNDHLGGAGCRKCALGGNYDEVFRKIDNNSFVRELTEVNDLVKSGELKILSEYKNSTTPILVENNYGKLLMSPRSLYNNKQMSLLNAVDKTQYFINKATDAHKGKYTYENAVYKGSEIKITITCPIHGDFEQLTDTHLQGKGCTKCKNEKVGWTYTAWSKAAPGNPGILYVLRCWNDDEEFYKIGITCQSKVGARYHNRLRMPYNYEIVEEIVSDDRKYIYKLEKKLKRNHKELAYEPKISFDGSKSECFIKYQKIQP